MLHYGCVPVIEIYDCVQRYTIDVRALCENENGRNEIVMVTLLERPLAVDELDKRKAKVS